MRYTDADAVIVGAAVGGNQTIYERCGRLRPHLILGQGDIYE